MDLEIHASVACMGLDDIKHGNSYRAGFSVRPSITNVYVLRWQGGSDHMLQH